MKIQISSKELQRALATVAKVIQKKNALAILDCAKLWEKDGQYLLTAGDAENELTVGVSLALIDGDFTPVCLRVETLLPALANLAEQPLNITVEKSGDSMPTTVEYLGGQFNIISHPADEYPSMKVVNENVTTAFDIDTAILLPALKAANSNTANDELRPVMCGVLLDVSVDAVTFVASDGHRLYKYKAEFGAGFTKGTGNIVLSRNVLSAIDTAFHSKENVHIESDNNFVVISCDDTRFVMRMVEGRYPNYNSVIPAKSAYHAVVNVKSFAAAIKRVSLFSSSTEQINLKFTGNTCELSTEDIDFNRSSHEKVEVDEKNIPDGFVIGLKAPNILQHLSTISTENVRLELDDSTRPLVMKEVNEKSEVCSTLLLMMMPMLIQ